MVSINVSEWKYAYCYYDSSRPEKLLKYVFMEMNRKFDSRQDWKFCWDLSNVMSVGNWIVWSDCVFSRRNLCSFLNYEFPKWLKCGITPHSYGIYIWFTPYSILNLDFWIFNYIHLCPCTSVSLIWEIWVNVNCANATWIALMF